MRSLWAWWAWPGFVFVLFCPEFSGHNKCCTVQSRAVQSSLSIVLQRSQFLSQHFSCPQNCFLQELCKKLILNFTLISRASNAVPLSEDSRTQHQAHNIPFVIDSSLLYEGLCRLKSEAWLAGRLSFVRNFSSSWHHRVVRLQWSAEQSPLLYFYDWSENIDTHSPHSINRNEIFPTVCQEERKIWETDWSLQDNWRKSKMKGLLFPFTLKIHAVILPTCKNMWEKEGVYYLGEGKIVKLLVDVLAMVVLRWRMLLWGIWRVRRYISVVGGGQGGLTGWPERQIIYRIIIDSSAQDKWSEVGNINCSNV